MARVFQQTVRIIDPTNFNIFHVEDGSKILPRDILLLGAPFVIGVAHAIFHQKLTDPRVVF